MLSYFVNRRKDTQSVDSKVLKTKTDRPPSSSKCAVCGSKKSRFIEEQQAKRLLVGDILIPEMHLKQPGFS